MSQGPPQPPPPGHGPPPPGGGYPRYPHWAPENAPPPPPSGGSIWLGIAIAAAIAFGSVVLTFALPSGWGNPFRWVPYLTFTIWLGLATFFTVRPESRRTGAGMFIAAGVTPIILAGACVLLIASFAQP